MKSPTYVSGQNMMCTKYISPSFPDIYNECYVAWECDGADGADES